MNAPPENVSYKYPIVKVDGPLEYVNFTDSSQTYLDELILLKYYSNNFSIDVFEVTVVV
jgi:hypothetical protein